MPEYEFATDFFLQIVETENQEIFEVKQTPVMIVFWLWSTRSPRSRLSQENTCTSPKMDNVGCKQNYFRGKLLCKAKRRKWDYDGKAELFETAEQKLSLRMLSRKCGYTKHPSEAYWRSRLQNNQLKALRRNLYKFLWSAFFIGCYIQNFRVEQHAFCGECGIQQVGASVAARKRGELHTWIADTAVE